MHENGMVVVVVVVELRMVVVVRMLVAMLELKGLVLAKMKAEV